jgi:hypothetical protein
VRRGCISLGNVSCDGCQKKILYPERYLTYDEEGKTRTLCMECSVQKGFAQPESEKAGADFLFNLTNE